MEVIIYTLLCLIMFFVLVGSILVVREFLFVDTRPYYWDESDKSLTEEQQAVALKYETAFRLDNVLNEIKYSRDENG